MPRYRFPDLFYDIRPECAVIDGSSRAVLLADRSGNSEVNVLCLPGAVVNVVSVPDEPFATSELEIVQRSAPVDRTPASTKAFLSKDAGGVQRSMFFGFNTVGRPLLGLTPDGVNFTNATADAAFPFADLVTGWVRVTWRASDGRTQFFWATDTGSNTEPAAWTQLGTDQTGLVGNIFNSTSQIEFGSQSPFGASPVFAGTIQYTSIRYTIGGTRAIAVDFSKADKLAPSFVCDTGQTVTINSAGDVGARICGARDAVQFTSGKMAVYAAPVAGAPGYITYDGGNDFSRSAQTALAQPIVRITTSRQVTWTSGDYLYDGAAGANTAGLVQTTSTPQINLNAGSSVAGNTGLAVDTRGVVTEVINGASSSLRVDRRTATTGNAGAGIPNGITLGANGASTAASFGHLAVSRVLVYQGAQYDAIARENLAREMMRKNRIAA
jgi:hypothetical protein